MKRDLASRVSVQVALGVAILLGVGRTPAARAEATAPARPATLELQLEYLEGALAEGLRTRDWKTLELAVQGFKSAKLTGKDLEISILRAELQAAFEAMAGWGGRLRAQIEVWALAARAKAGDEKALAALRALGAKEISAVAPPSAELWKKNPTEYKAVQKAHAEFVLTQEKRDHALLCLALQKEPGIVERALAILRAKVKPEANPMGGAVFMLGGGGGGDPNTSQLVLAALAADAQPGWNGLLEFCSSEDEKVSVDVQIPVYTFLLELASPDPRFQLADAPFKVDRDIAALLPKEAVTQLAKPFPGLAKRWKPDANAFSSPLVTAAGKLPVQADNADTIAALETLKSKFTGPNPHIAQKELDKTLKKFRGTAEPKDDAGKGTSVKPPKAPEEF